MRAPTVMSTQHSGMARPLGDALRGRRAGGVLGREYSRRATCVPHCFRGSRNKSGSYVWSTGFCDEDDGNDVDGSVQSGGAAGGLVGTRTNAFEVVRGGSVSDAQVATLLATLALQRSKKKKPREVQRGEGGRGGGAVSMLTCKGGWCRRNRTRIRNRNVQGL